MKFTHGNDGSVNITLTKEEVESLALDLNDVGGRESDLGDTELACDLWSNIRIAAATNFVRTAMAKGTDRKVAEKAANHKFDFGADESRGMKLMRANLDALEVNDKVTFETTRNDV